MLEKFVDRMITVKSFVTVALTIVFCILSIRGSLPQEFMVIYTMVIGFYFGTQTDKKNIDKITQNIKEE